ncbi:hypothetical protein GE115_13085 [Agromyces sp. CFH 90414]|uniref:Uncharacterized protein n=1 Tax=Agromyces agglutinans TaxID=2662258 RepID=A0A6I2F5Q5_9MICO|nr:hypothetical protein [Agromyces agglutinans]MRG60795.1 hypothetical protein [Agromyces agglutinans]
MIGVDLLAVLATVAFVGLFVGSALLASDGLALDRRAALLERRDPGRAEAMRRAQSITDLRGVGFGDEGFSAVCTPTRRSALDMARVRASGSDLRLEPPEEALPPMPTTVVALAHGSHVAPRQPAPATPPRVTPPRVTPPRVTPPVRRTDPATTRARADSR